MKILLGVHQFFPNFYTGTERYVLNLARQLQRMGHYVKILTYAYNDETGFHDGCSANILRKEYFYEDLPVIALRHRKQPEDLTFIFDLTDKDIYDEAMDIFKKDNFNIYHCAHLLRMTSVMKAARDSGVKNVLMVTDYWLMCPQGIMLRSDNTLCNSPDHGRNCKKYCFTNIDKERIQKRFSDSLNILGYCNYLLSPSRFLIEAYNHTGFISADRFILSRHGFDYAKNKTHVKRNPGEILTFGYIGTVQYHKGIHVMIDGFRKTSHQNIRLQVWGGSFHEMEYRKNVEKTAEEDSRIEFRGSYNFNDIEKILETIDVVIVPSIWYENAPLTISTSLAHGIPVITSDIGGMKEAVLNGHNGFTFKVGDTLDLSITISKIADNPEIIDSLKLNIQYPIRIEEEAFNTELIYKQAVAVE